MATKVTILFTDGNVMEEYFDGFKELEEFIATLTLEFLNGSIESVEIEDEEDEEGDYSN